MKSKIAAKTGGLEYQWQIMQSLGMGDEEIKQYVYAKCSLLSIIIYILSLFQACCKFSIFYGTSLKCFVILYVTVFFLAHMYSSSLKNIYIYIQCRPLLRKVIEKDTIH